MRLSRGGSDHVQPDRQVAACARAHEESKKKLNMQNVT